MFFKNMQVTSALVVALATTTTAAATTTTTRVRELNHNSCADVTVIDNGREVPWYDSDGEDFNCNWYATTPGACAEDGGNEIYRNFGLLGNDACCACGGGIRNNPNPVIVTRCGVDIRLYDWRLAVAVNNLRAAHGHARLPGSAALFATAKAHVEHQPTITHSCNVHSWEADEEDDRFDACCYEPDHDNTNCMYLKPSQITSDWSAFSNGCTALSPIFTQIGYEISYTNFNHKITVDEVVAKFESDASDSFIMFGEAHMEQFIQYIGCSMGDHVAHCWFMTDDSDNVPVF